MKLLLDTHVFIWAMADPQRLSSKASRAIRSTENDLVVSCVSLLEIAIKVQSGKLDIPMSRDFITDRLKDIGIHRVLDITPSHAYAMLSIPRVHGDPFDRLLAAQCVAENLRLISADRVFARYPIEVLW